MPHSTLRSLFLIATSVLLLTMTACKAAEKIEPTATPTSSLQPVTEIPPTPTETPTVLPPTATETATSTSSPTCMLTLDEDSVCRAGPGWIYSIDEFLKAGETAQILGCVEDQSFCLIPFSEEGASCWISMDSVTLEGNTSSVVVLTPPPTPTITPTPETFATGGMRFYLIALEAGGPFGCNDGLVYFESGLKSTGDVENGIKVALDALFDLKVEYWQGYYNPIYQSNLRVESVTIDAGGYTTIELRGSFANPKTECQAFRIRDQVFQTVTQFSQVSGRPRILINGKEFGDLLQAIQN
jgi:hypothetical protein